jgi:DNA-binding transcriptional MerR regulator
VELTLDDLTREVADRIRRAGLTQGNGQVSALPDQRTLRYYTTIGLLDRPLAVRGRQAIYGRRHVVQAVAVKRLQAAGLSLGEIQARLAGLPTPQLAEVAEAEAEAPALGGVPSPALGGVPSRAGRWWAAAAAPPAAPAEAPTTMTAVPLDGALTLLIPTVRPLTPSDVAAIRLAAAPLMTTLAALGHPPLDQKERP